MAIFERRNDRPAASSGPQRSGGWRAERSCCLARNAAAWRQGKKIANKPLRVKVGERSERIVARDPPEKGRYGRGPKQLDRRASAQGTSPPPRSQHHWSNSAIEPQRFASSDPAPTEKAQCSCRWRRHGRFGADPRYARESAAVRTASATHESFARRSQHCGTAQSRDLLGQLGAAALGPLGTAFRLDGAS